MCALWYFFFISCTDEKDGLTASLKESNRLVEEAKQREVQMQSKLNSMEQQVHVLTDRDQEVCSALTGALMFFFKQITRICTAGAASCECFDWLCKYRLFIVLSVSPPEDCPFSEMCW